MEYVRCNLCGADETGFLFYAEDRNSSTEEKFKLVKCRRCGLVYLNPRPDGNEIKKHYPEWCRTEAPTDVNIEKTRILGLLWREAMKKKTHSILKYKKSGKILDIGCGNGSLLRYLKDLGWDAYGVEINKTASNYAREVLGLNIFNGRLEETNYQEQFFDVISLLHVLEHLSDPSYTLKIIHSLLKKDGILIIEVPNFGGFDSWLFKEHWFRIDAPLHLYHFTPLTLQIMLKKHGFNTVEKRFVREQTRYVSGYSESLRYWLIDFGLYPPLWKTLSARKLMTANVENPFRHSGSIWKDLFHSFECGIFCLISYFMNNIGLGSKLLCIAKKKE